MLRSCAACALLVCIVVAARPAAADDPAPAAPTRVEQWREDLQTLRTELPKRHKNLFFKLTRDEFERSIADLDASIPDLEDHEIIARMMRIVASVGDAHTTLSPWPRAWDRFYPFRLQWFSDGLFVVATMAGQRAALGAQVLEIGETPVAQAQAAVAALIPHDNGSGLKYHGPLYLTSPEVLHTLRILPEMARARYLFRDAKGETFAMDVAPMSSWLRLMWFYAPDPSEVSPPLYLKQTRSPYWFEYLEDSQTLYFQYNRCVSVPDRPFPRFCEGLLASLDAHPVKRLVIDLRHNAGGNSALADPLIDELKARPKINRKGRLFALVGPRTFSSAVLNALRLRSETHVIIVGESTGGRPNHYGEVRRFSLPNCKLAVTYSTKYFAPSEHNVSSLAPDLPVDLSSADYVAGRDPVLEAVLTYQATPDATHPEAPPDAAPHAATPPYKHRQNAIGSPPP